MTSKENNPTYGNRIHWMDNLRTIIIYQKQISASQPFRSKAQFGAP